MSSRKQRGHPLHRLRRGMRWLFREGGCGGDDGASFCERGLWDVSLGGRVGVGVGVRVRVSELAGP